MKKFIVEINKNSKEFEVVVIDTTIQTDVDYALNSGTTIYSDYDTAQYEADKLNTCVDVSTLPQINFEQVSPLYQLAFPKEKNADDTDKLDALAAVRKSTAVQPTVHLAHLANVKVLRNLNISGQGRVKIPLYPIRDADRFHYNGTISSLSNLLENGRSYIVGTFANGGKTTMINALQDFCKAPTTNMYDDEYVIMHLMVNERAEEFEVFQRKVIDGKLHYLFGNFNDTMNRVELENTLLKMHDITAQHLKQGQHVIWTVDSWNKMCDIYMPDYPQANPVAGGFKIPTRDRCKEVVSQFAGIYTITDSSGRGGIVVDSNGNKPSLTVIGTVLINNKDTHLPINGDTIYQQFLSICTGELIPKPFCQRQDTLTGQIYKYNDKTYQLVDLLKTYGSSAYDTHVSNIR